MQSWTATRGRPERVSVCHPLPPGSQQPDAAAPGWCGGAVRLGGGHLKLDLRQAILRRGGGADIDPEAAGLLDGVSDEREREDRARLVRELARDGVSVEELREAIETDRLSLLPLERALSGDARDDYTLAEIAERSGVEEPYLRALRRALGLPRADGRERVGSETDVDAAEMVQRFREAGLPDDRLLEYALIVHQQEQLGSEVVGRTELASGRLAGASEVTVCFADLVGFTELGEEIAPAGLGAVAGRLTEHAMDCARSPVRLVKMIGDAALLVSTDTDALLVAALELMDAVAHDPELP